MSCLIKLLLLGMVKCVVSFSRSLFVKGTVKSAIFKDGICCFIETAFHKVYKAEIVKCGEL